MQFYKTILIKAKTLIKHNAELNIKNKRNNSALSISEEKIKKLNSNLLYKIQNWLLKSSDLKEFILLELIRKM